MLSFLLRLRCRAAGGPGKLPCLASILLLAPGVWAEDPAPPAEALFTEIESRLLQARSLVVEFTVESSGAFTATLQGEVELVHRNQARFDAAGSFGESEYALKWQSDGHYMTGMSGGASYQKETPEQLNEAIIIGMTRMGLLHNLAVLGEGGTPDHAEGGVRDWVRATNISLGPSEKHDGRSLLPLRFDIVVSGVSSASAVLWVDAEDKLPAWREQTVDFGEGNEMKVTERYQRIQIKADSSAPPRQD